MRKHEKKDYGCIMNASELATAVVPTTNTNFVDFVGDRLTVKYSGKGTHSHDVGAVRANKVLPKTCSIGFFEVTIIDVGQKNNISVGLAPGDFPLAKLPGHETNTYGLIGDSGKIFQDGVARGDGYCSAFSTGDIIGCGCHYEKKEIFFTFNGRYLGTAFRKVNGDLFPTVGMHSPGECVQINFGQKPFRFDLNSYVYELHQEWVLEVERLPVDLSALDHLVASYLSHYGFEDTFYAFEKSHSSTRRVQDFNLSTRKQIRHHVLTGNMMNAIKLVSDAFPNVFDDKSNRTLLMCRCQEFIELIKQGEMDRCLDYAVNALGPFYEDQIRDDEDQRFLQDVVALLAYQDPHNSPLKYLLSLEQREIVADSLNTSILTMYGTNAHAARSPLEVVLAQLQVAQNQIREENGQKGVVFQIEKYM